VYPSANNIRTAAAAAAGASAPSEKTETEYMYEYIGELITMFGENLAQLDNHIAMLLGPTANEKVSSPPAPDPTTSFSKLSQGLAMLRQQAQWLAALRERIQKI
jgi:hypothetical protein